MKKRSLCILGICLWLSLVGCDGTQTAEKPSLLTHVYTEETFRLPEGYEYEAPVTMEPEYIVRCRRMTETDEGFEVAVSQWQVYTDGTEPVMLWEKTEGYPLFTCITGTTTYDLYQLRSDNGYVYSLRRTEPDGDTDVADGLMEGAYLTGFHVDDDGYVYLFSHDGIHFLNPALEDHGSLTGISINGFAASGNRVIVDGARGMEAIVAEVSAREADITETLAIPAGARGWVLHESGVPYYLTGDGLYRYTVDDTGAAAGELQMDFVNSNLSALSYASVRLLSDGRVFLSYNETDATGMSVQKPALFTPSPDIELPQVTVLEVYSSDPNAANMIPQAVVRFNKAHVGEVRILWHDYSQYRTQEDPYAGETKLCMELEAGLISPDICFTETDSDLFRLLRKNDNLTDLAALMADDPVYNGDNLFGCVKTTYTVDGKLTALPLYIEEGSAYVNADFLAGDNESWTITDMLDISASLPEGAVMGKRLSRQTALYGLMGSHWPGLFIDREAGICDFDSGDFTALLSYIDTLPENPEPLSEAAAYLFETGKMVMAQKTSTSGEGLAAILQDKLYGENRVLAGYPTRNGLSGTSLSTYGNIFAVTSTCASPAVAWEFVRDTILHRYESDGVLKYCIPIWKSEFDRAVEICREDHCFATYDGMLMRRASTIQLDEDGTYRGQTGKPVELTQADAEAYKAWLDTVGRPLSRTVIPTEVNNIITEELNRFYEGASTPQTCADAIQSRVSLWLDENG